MENLGLPAIYKPATTLYKTTSLMHIIAGLFKNKTIHSPKGQQTRPTSGRLRESLFNICQHYIEDAHFLDLFAGSGAMGIEAISRGANSATFIDNSKESIRCIQQNIRELHLEKQSQTFYGDVFQALKKLAKQSEKFTIIYADPPYDAHSKTPEGVQTYSSQVLAAVDETNLLVPSGMLFVEDSHDFKPETENLKTLVYVGSRKMGRSMLHQWKKEVS